MKPDFSKIRLLVAGFADDVSHADVLAIVKAKTIKRRKLADKEAVKTIIHNAELWLTVKHSAEQAYDYLMDPARTAIDLDLPIVQKLMAGLFQGGAPKSLAMEIDALGWEMVSRADVAGVPESDLSTGIIATARAWKETA